MIIRLLAAVCLAVGAFAQTVIPVAPGATVDMSAARVKPPSLEIGDLPSAASSEGLEYTVTDSATAGDCSLGGGTIRTKCVSDGTSWVAVGAITSGAALVLSGAGVPSTVDPNSCDDPAEVDGRSYIDTTATTPVFTRYSCVFTGAGTAGWSLVTNIFDGTTNRHIPIWNSTLGYFETRALHTTDLLGGELVAGRGGTGGGAPSNHQIMVGNGPGLWGRLTLPTGCNATTGKLHYNSSVPSFTCETDASVGGGDASTNTSSSVDGEVTLFNGTTGKSLKRATQTGVALLTSGVLGVVSGTASDCVKVDGSSGACGGGGGGAPTDVTVVSYSATPTFTVPASTTMDAGFKITLTGNVTSSTLASAVNGQNIHFLICQDSTGGRSFVWPTNVIGEATIDATTNSTASSCFGQNFIYDGTNAVAVSSGNVELVPGGSGALIRSQNTIDVDPDVVDLIGNDKTITGFKTFSKIRLPDSTSPSSALCDDSSEYNTIHIDNDAPSGQMIYVCRSTGWELQGGSGGVADPGSNGLVARTGSGTAAARTITAGTGVSVTNGNGVSGNPTIALAEAMPSTGVGIFMPFGPAVTGNTAAFTANLVRYAEFTLQGTITINAFHVRVTTTGASGSGLQFGIYDSSCNVVAKSTAITGVLNSTGGKRSTLASPLTIGPGTYRLAMTTEDTTVIFAASTGNNHGDIINADSSNPRFFTGSNASTGTGGSIDLPSSCGTKTGTTTNMPAVAMVR